MLRKSPLQCMRSPCNPLCLDLLMWTVANRANLFRKVRLLDSGHVVAALPIAKNDIVCYIPSALIMSVDKLKDIHAGALHSSLQFGAFLNVDTVGAPMPFFNDSNIDSNNHNSSGDTWWPGMTRGHFALLSLMTTLKLNVDGKGGGHAAHIDLLTSQEDVLIESDIVDTAAEAIDTKHFELAAQPIQRATHLDVDEIRRHMLDCFVAFERRSVVLYQKNAKSAVGEDDPETRSLGGNNNSNNGSFGLPSYETSAFVQAAARGEENGVVRGLVPIIDLCTHAPMVATGGADSATCTIGFPDADICHWLAMERGVLAPSRDAVLLQAVRDIAEGELLTVDRALMMGLDDMATTTTTEDDDSSESLKKREESREMFEKWFGHTYY